PQAIILLAQACGATQSVTFTRDVAPILYHHCISCHRSGEVGPFPLVTYADAAKRAELIAQVTASRYMPPWKPERGYADFEGERVLTPAEIGALRSWADSGAPQGDPSSLRPAPAPTAPKIAHPDLTVRMPRPFSIPADGPDLYRCFVVPLGLSADRYADSI